MLEAVYPDRAAPRRARRHGRVRLSALRREGAAARAAQDQLHADADPGAAAVVVRRAVRRVLGCAAPGAADPGSRGGHARGREGRLRHAPAAHLARRDGHPGSFVQRHDEAPGACARGDAAQSARGRGRARQPRGHPRAPVDRRHFAGAGSHGAHREPGRLHDPGRRRRERHRQAAGGGGQGQLAVRAVRARLQRAPGRRPDRMARATGAAGRNRAGAS